MKYMILSMLLIISLPCILTAQEQVYIRREGNVLIRRGSNWEKAGKPGTVSSAQAIVYTGPEGRVLVSEDGIHWRRADAAAHPAPETASGKSPELFSHKFIVGDAELPVEFISHVHGPVQLALISPEGIVMKELQIHTAAGERKKLFLGLAGMPEGLYGIMLRFGDGSVLSSAIVKK